MTLENVNSIMIELASLLKCDYYYSHDNKRGPNNRFLIFYYSGDDDFYADGKNYQEKKSLTIEFYSPTKELESEKIIKDTLNSYGLPCSVNSVWINSEKEYQTTYDTEVIINEQSAV